MPVLFLTDILIFLLVIMVLCFAWYARRREHLRVPWQQVGRNRLAMSASVILLAYVLIGLLDSLHFYPRLESGEANGHRYSTEVISVLDTITRHLRENTERTYSAPFATHAYSKETIYHPDGSVSREYPRLQFGGAHLADTDKRFHDILMKSLVAVLAGVLLWLVLGLVIILILARAGRRSLSEQLSMIRTGKTVIPWRVVLVTLGVLLVLSSWAWHLSHYYHIFGTDKVGQDVFYQALKSIRTGLMIGT
ncbi:MAG: ABC transporter permease, partial [Gammaproteobacteria bacterium]|nr:ABC transporter permease [Gammaproteobacteria bacterium]